MSLRRELFQKILSEINVEQVANEFDIDVKTLLNLIWGKLDVDRNFSVDEEEVVIYVDDYNTDEILRQVRYDIKKIKEAREFMDKIRQFEKEKEDKENMSEIEDKVERYKYWKSVMKKL